MREYRQRTRVSYCIQGFVPVNSFRIPYSAIRTAYTHLSEDDQLAYLSEGGNVAPVVLGLRKAYNDKVDRNQMLLDEIKTLTDSFDQAKARTLAHEQANGQCLLPNFQT